MTVSQATIVTMATPKARLRAAPAPKPGSIKSDKARAAILSAAEDLFASRGFAATRLDDVAEAVGLTRAGLFYYFRDKKALYDATLQNAFAALDERLNAILGIENIAIAGRIEMAVEVWVDAVMARPTLARLILRFVADAAEDSGQLMHLENDRILRRFWALFQEGCSRGELNPIHDDPFHAASTVIGTTVFYVSALAPLVPKGGFEPLNPAQALAQKKEMLFATRRLLGISSGSR